MIFRQGVSGEIMIADDPGEKVVEIMRDAAGKRSERFHFFRVEKLTLEFTSGRFGLVLDCDVLECAVNAWRFCSPPFDSAEISHPDLPAFRGQEWQFEIER